MSNIELVKPSVVDGVEFYVSKSGDESGVSQNGLARLCGVSSGTMSGFISALENDPNRLKLNGHGIFSARMSGENGGNSAKIINSETAVKIIEYYAFESRAKSEVAMFSFRKFAKMGFDSWVKSITGYAQSQDTQSVLSAIQQVLQQLTEMKVEVKEYRDIRGVTTTVYVNLDQMLTDLPKQKSLPSKDLTTVKEWLQMKGITLEVNKLKSFGRQVSDTYKSTVGRKPSHKISYIDGRWKNIGKGYPVDVFPMIEMVWREFSQM